MKINESEVSTGSVTGKAGIPSLPFGKGYYQSGGSNGEDGIHFTPYSEPELKSYKKAKHSKNELKKMKEELEKQGALLTPAARSDKELAYQRKLRDYQNLVDDTNKELQKRDQEYGTKMLSEIAKVVRAIGEKEKYTAIMDAMQALYYDKELDITNKVIEEYNKTIK